MNFSNPWNEHIKKAKPEESLFEWRIHCTYHLHCVEFKQQLTNWDENDVDRLKTAFFDCVLKLLF